MPKTLTETLEGLVESEGPTDFANLPGFAYPPTGEQEAIILAAREFLPVLMIEAGAGTGKTATLEFLAAVLDGLGQYTAFNRALVVESTEKFKRFPRMSCNSQHSLAFRAVGRKYSHRLNGPRVRSNVIAAQLGLRDYSVPIDADGTPKPLAAGFLASQVLIALGRFSQSADREIEEKHFRYIDGIEIPTEEKGRQRVNNRLVSTYLLPFARKAWLDIESEEGSLPFTHDYYVKIWQLGTPVIPVDYILIDESQDLAPVFLAVLEQQDASIILVGDSAQQIYEWRGAVNALAAFPDAPRLFLSQSFRFGPAIANLANNILESLEEPTELRLKGLESIDSRVERVDSPDAILTRTNAVAVGYLLNGLAEGRSPFLVGGGADVIRFMKAVLQLQKGQTTAHPELACFTSWTEVVEYTSTEEGEDLKLMVNLIDAHGARTILDALQAMPEEGDADFVISTAHKSKGRQWPSVRLAPDFPTNPDSNDSDRRLLYVAATRAQILLDVEDCPFFRGEGALKVADLIGSSSKAPSSPSKGSGFYTPPKLPGSTKAPRNAEGDPSWGDFSWTKWNGESSGKAWLVQGPPGHAGETVTVTRKSGEGSRKRLGDIVWEDDETAIYEV